jgi:hypothetical protein
MSPLLSIYKKVFFTGTLFICAVISFEGNPKKGGGKNAGIAIGNIWFSTLK